ncbi:MAG: hypothetical protein M3033_05625 [Acidobacteriota bacterium]|nr:hypothetical protein [Acidobacteriota bacterium]
MRLIKVSAPQGRGSEVAQIAFDAGIGEVSVSQAETRGAQGKVEPKELVDIQTSTPKAGEFIEKFLTSSIYNADEFSINVRQPRAVISKASASELTVPFVEPAIDVLEDLWQFTHVTTSFLARNFIAACLIAYGMIQQQTLLMIAGLLFLPLLPVLLSISFGAWTRQWKLVGQAALAFLVTIVLLLAGGALVALISSPPLRYNEFNSPAVGFLISLAVGVGAGFATTDDVGRRELLGLAATAQIVLIPVWFGISFVFGFSQTENSSHIAERALAFVINASTIIVVALATYALLRFKRNTFERWSGGKVE